MKRKIFMLLIAVEVLMFIALLLGDVGVLTLALTQNPIKNISMHITTAILIYVCVVAYKRSE